MKVEWINRWLQAEEAAVEERSERALTTLLQSLPDAVPPAGLAERVLTEMDAVWTRSRIWMWSGRAALLGAVAAMALLLPAVPALALYLAPPVSDLMQIGAAAVKLGAAWLAATISVWEILSSFGRALTLVLNTPQAVVGLSLVTAVGLSAFLTLYGLTAQHRGGDYVRSS